MSGNIFYCISMYSIHIYKIYSIQYYLVLFHTLYTIIALHNNYYYNKCFGSRGLMVRELEFESQLRQGLSVGEWMYSTLSTFNTTTEVPLSKAPNPQLLQVCVHGVCLFTAVCVRFGWVNCRAQLLGHMSRHFHFHFTFIREIHSVYLSPERLTLPQATTVMCQTDILPCKTCCLPLNESSIIRWMSLRYSPRAQHLSGVC